MRISTIIPAYNRADLIGETLRTVLSQTRPPDEVIVVDDGSTDGTPDAVAAFGNQVTLIRQANAGAGPARNTGFSRSSGEIVHFMDSDDLCSLNFYERAARRIEAGSDMTYGPWLKTRIDGDRLDPEPVVLQQAPVPAGMPLDVLALTVEWVTVFQPCLFRRDLILRAGPYRHDLKPSEDTELLYRILAAAEAPGHIDDVLILYRVHPENQVSEQNLALRLIDRANLWLVLEQHARSRKDFGGSFLRTFHRKKYEVADAVRPFDPDKAALLERGVGRIDRKLHPLRRMAQHTSARLKHIATGNPYPAVLAAGPLRDGQMALIGQLGYRLAN